MTPEEAKAHLLQIWKLLLGGSVTVTDAFKQRWNELADVARQNGDIVPKYPQQPNGPPAEGFR